MSCNNFQIKAWMASVATAAALTVVGAALGQATEQAQLLASDGAASDQLSTSVSITNGLAILGAPQEDTGTTNSGAAYVYRDNGGGVWVEEAKLLASDKASNDQFGISVAISGNVAVVGAWQDSDAGLSSGSAYVFRRSGTTWTQEQKLLGSLRANTDRFGLGVAIDGNVIAIGSDRASAPGAADGGAVYVFRYNGAAWVEEARLNAGDPVDLVGLGEFVSISGDTIIASARFDDSLALNAGAAYVFRYDGVSSWSQESKLTAADFAGGDNFGSSVSVSGNTAVVGSQLDEPPGTNSGSAYVFDRTGSVWSQSVKLAASDSVSGQNFGKSVAINGNLMAVGAFLDNSQTGAAYIFNRSGSTWSELVKLDVLNVSALNVNDQFGNSIALSSDSRVAVGSIGDDVNGSAAGAAYVFSITVPVADTDGDGLDDADEIIRGTNPNDADSDDDGLNDGAEVMLAGLGSCPDPLDADSDDDGIPDGTEFGGFTALCDNDTDNDGLSDGAESGFGTDPADADSDNDGISDGGEVTLAAGGGCPNPTDSDSDDDGLNDGAENTAGTSPCGADSDGDGLSDSQEPSYSTNPLDADSDDDGLSDGAEVDTAMGGGCPSPIDADSDDDTLSDGAETTLTTDPCNVDTDGDGLNDNVDPDPNVPAVTADELAQWTVDVAQDIVGLPLSEFAGPNNFTRMARRNTLAVLTALAALLIDTGNYAAAHALLSVVEGRIDGTSPPPDWLVGPSRAAQHGEINLIMTLLELLE